MPHEPEPWEVGALEQQFTWSEILGPEDAQGHRVLIGSTVGPWPWRGHNARRIRACVNALRGVPTEFLEKLEPGYLAEMIEHIVAIGNIVSPHAEGGGSGL